MEMTRIILSIVSGGLVLFFWTGFAQSVLPWGVKSVKQHTGSDGDLGSRLEALTSSGMLYVKDRVAAFIAIQPESYYSMARYFGIELVTQFLVAALLTGILVLTDGFADGTRLILITLAALAGIASVDVQYWNWWGFSYRYSLGVAVNRFIGYLLAGFVLLNWVL